MDKGRPNEKVRVVVDACVVAKWIIPGEPWESNAEKLKEKLISGEVTAYAPELLLYEITSTILKSVVAQKLNLEDGIRALEAIGQLDINVETINWEDSQKILLIATKSDLTIYDSSYIYIAQKFKAKLITADEELKEKSKNITASMLLKDF